ncbi:Hpt domain-containing protein [Shimia aestuarii]|uniref:Hpt domain-containing protein n=1 Tax=Shimia aestuarii TaxID=254406 RepID=UPI001FB5169A|nr:Hpt domain-containing protein [Shimia aestuarii]
MIDWRRIDELRGEIGEDDFGEVVEIFLEEVEEGIGRLRAHQTNEELAAHLHFLKGSALNLGFQSFSTLCQAGETAATEATGIEVDLVALEACYEQSKEVFEQGLSR